MKASPDELSGVEQAVLLVLMAEGRPVPNPELEYLGPVLKKDYRDRLKDKKLIDVVPGRPMTLELIEQGYDLCRELMGTDPPPGVRGQSKALYTLMKGLCRYVDREDLELHEVFPARGADQPDTAKTAAPQDTSSASEDLHDRVRSAYAKLADYAPARLIRLVRLRAELADVPRHELDAVLVDLNRLPGVSLLPQEDQKWLTDEDRAAALRIGVKDNHVIVIED
jgi:hypothetical protein